MPKNVSCYIAKMLKNHPGSIKKLINKLKPGTLVEALKVTSKEIDARNMPQFNRLKMLGQNSSLNQMEKIVVGSVGRLFEAKIQNDCVSR